MELHEDGKVENVGELKFVGKQMSDISIARSTITVK